MRRRLIQHGPSSLSVSLPHRWVREHNLDKGDEVTLSEHEDHIRVHSKVKAKAPLSTHISLTEADVDAQRDLILMLYQKGFDEITVYYTDEATVRNVHALLNEMHLGYEIVAQEHDHLMIRNLSPSNGQEFENCLRRSFRLLVEYAQRVRDRMDADPAAVTSSYLFHEASIGRICHYCKKIALSLRNRDSAYYYLLCQSLLSTSAEIGKLHQQVLDMEEAPARLCDLADRVIGLLSSATGLYTSFSLSGYSQVKQEAEDIGRMLEQPAGTGEHAALQHLERVVHRSQDLLYAAMALQKWDKQQDQVIHTRE